MVFQQGGSLLDDSEQEALLVFASEYGWMAMRMQGAVVRQLSFGHPSAIAAIAALGAGSMDRQKPSDCQHHVVERLQRYAAGEAVDFGDLLVDSGNVTEFQRRVLKACREIIYGRTITYGKLAEEAQCPGAARAVGSCMARNRVPLIIPCHRVVRAGGDIGPYSAAGGSATKRRLLDMEAAGCHAENRVGDLRKSLWKGALPEPVANKRSSSQGPTAHFSRPISTNRRPLG